MRALAACASVCQRRAALGHGVDGRSILGDCALDPSIAIALVATWVCSCAMRIHFVGADLEENLGLGILAAVAERAGHRARIVAFNDISEIDDTVKHALARDPD